MAHKFVVLHRGPPYIGLFSDAQFNKALAFK